MAFELQPGGNPGHQGDASPEPDGELRKRHPGHQWDGRQRPAAPAEVGVEDRLDVGQPDPPPLQFRPIACLREERLGAEQPRRMEDRLFERLLLEGMERVVMEKDADRPLGRETMGGVGDGTTDQVLPSSAGWSVRLRGGRCARRDVRRKRFVVSSVQHSACRGWAMGRRRCGRSPIAVQAMTVGALWPGTPEPANWRGRRAPGSASMTGIGSLIHPRSILPAFDWVSGCNGEEENRAENHPRFPWGNRGKPMFLVVSGGSGAGLPRPPTATAQ